MEEELKYILIQDFETLNGLKVQNINLSYQVFGKKLGTAPVILINHALTGNSLVTGKNGWWSEVIGEEKPLILKSIQFYVLIFQAMDSMKIISIIFRS